MSALGQKQTFNDYLPNVRLGSLTDSLRLPQKCLLSGGADYVKTIGYVL